MFSNNSYRREVQRKNRRIFLRHALCTVTKFLKKHLKVTLKTFLLWSLSTKWFLCAIFHSTYMMECGFPKNIQLFSNGFSSWHLSNKKVHPLFCFAEVWLDRIRLAIFLRNIASQNQKNLVRRNENWRLLQSLFNSKNCQSD